MSILRKSKHLESNFELQITALIDTLVIILLFLLKSISSDSLDLETSKGIKMPSVMNGISTGKGSRLDISATGVSWNGKTYVESINFDLKNASTGAEGWKNLDVAMQATAELEKKNNVFDGKLLLQADKETPFPALQEVLRVAKSHGYKDIRFVASKIN